MLADIIARFARTQGNEVYFLTGNDEHAGKVAKAALAAGVTPKAFVDEKAEGFKKFYAQLGISYSDFIQTTDQKKHWPGAIELWKRLDAAGDIYKKKYAGLYCQGCEEFKPEKDLIDGLCPLHNTKPEYLEEENYFFRLSKYTEAIKAKIQSDELQILPTTRKNEIVSLLNEGLEDISFSRPAKEPLWGIPVPGDVSQVMYVWCDALANYISALGFGADSTLFEKFWPADLHLLGKDILRFHAAVWPGMLLSAGIPLPKAILAHGFITSGGKKMSKTIGNVIDPKELIAEYGVDAVRYYIAREISPFDDGDLTHEKFKDAYNGNLANGLGNLVARVMKMASSYLEGPVTVSEYANAEFESLMGTYEIQKASDLVWSKIQDIDLRIQKTEPFKLYKTDPEAAKEIVKELVMGVSHVGQLLASILPETSQKIEAAVKANTMPETLFARK